MAVKQIDVNLGVKEFYQVPINSPHYQLIMQSTVQPEHYQNPTAFLAMLYRNITQTKVIGQDAAVFAVVKAIRDHVCSIHNPQFTHIKVNPLIIGPTGTGKTYTVQLAAELVGLPYVEFKMAQVTPLPIVGSEKLPRSLERLIERTKVTPESVKKHLSTLTQSGHIDQETAAHLATASDITKDRESYQLAKTATQIYLAERGIIFLDEFDKIAYTGKGNELGTKEMVQNELMDYLGGTKVKMDERSGVAPHLVGHQINTNNILFFLAGAFSELDALQKGETIRTEDIKNYGIKPELLGRTGIPIVYQPLSHEQLTTIMTEAQVHPYELSMKDLLIADIKNDFPHVEVTTSAITYIVEKAAASQLGARYLRNQASTLSIKILRRLLYHVGMENREKKVTIDSDFLKNII